MELSSAVSRAQDEELIVVLHIEEGIGLNAAEAILLQASLSGHKLDSEPVKPGHTTLFDCNLVWETERKSIKRMKTENMPVRLDCFALRNSKNDINTANKEHIGYILFQVKNIPIVSLPKALQIKPKWAKLIGLSKDWRPHKPEFLVSIMITSREFLTTDHNQILETQGLESGDSIVFDENPIPCMLTSQRGIFIRLLKREGLLQVGNIDTNCDVFTITITMKNVRYLENIKLGERFNCKEIFLNYVLLGNPHSRLLDKKFNRSHQIQEKVSINFRSSLADLQEYLEKIFFIPLELLCGDQILGTAEVKANQLIKTTSLKEFLEKNPSSLLEIDVLSDIKTSHELHPSSNRPIIEYKLSIQYIATQKLHQTVCLENYKRNQEIDLQAGGDCIEERHQPIVRGPKNKTLSDIPEVRSESENSNRVKSVTVAKHVDSKKNANLHIEPNSLVQQSEKADMLDSNQTQELPRLFSYNLQLKSIKFNRTPEKGIWQLSFFHDKSDTPRAFINKELHHSDFDNDNQANLTNLELKLYFTASANQIVNLVSSPESSCAFCIKGPQGTHAKAQLDSHSLLIASKENAPGLVLLQDKIGQVVAMANLSVHIKDLGINFTTKFKTPTSQTVQDHFDIYSSDINVTRRLDSNQKMSVIDETSTHQIVEELDTWKKHMQNTFLEDLKRKEENLMDKLKSGWTQKQAIYEEDLIVRAGKLSTLTVSLEGAQKSLKEKERQYSRDETEIANKKRELEKSYNNQLLAIRERARRMESDLLHEMKLKEIRYQEIEQCNQHLKTENCELHQQNDSLIRKLKDLEANLVPKCEVEQILQERRLLKEKLEAVHQSKLFYKEQWAKSCRENHKVRRENIFNAKGYLHATQCDRLSNVLDDQNYQLNMDKQELDQIKHFLSLSDGEV